MDENQLDQYVPEDPLALLIALPQKRENAFYHVVQHSSKS